MFIQILLCSMISGQFGFSLFYMTYVVESDLKGKSEKYKECMLMMNLGVLGVLWVENSVNLVKMHIRQVIYPMGLAIIYFLYALIYQLNNSHIFPSVDSSPFVLYSSLLVWVVLILLHHQFTCWLYDNVKAAAISNTIV